ncbi:MAG TPA: SBBP repeat-containing protein, partial [Dehalococcoidia bacterium]
MRHKVIFGWVSLFILFSMVAYPLSDMLPRNYNSGISDTQVGQAAEEAFNELPILFIENRGQLDGAVEYYVKAPSQTLYLTKESIIFDLSRYNQAEATGVGDGQADRLVFSLDFLGADKQPTIEGIGRDSAVVNYLTGNDPEKWHTGIPTCREVIYRDIYPAVDLRLRGNGDGLEYDFVVKPGAAPEDIRLAYNGINSLAVESGELVVGTAFGNMKQGRPFIYQQIADEKVEVAGGFRLGSDNSYGFFVAAYNDRYPLIIDPTLIYATYLGGSTGEDMGMPGGIGQDSGWGIAVDSAGSAYVVGITGSSDFPTERPYQGTIAGGFDVFVTKLSATGGRLVYSTYLGGSNWDDGISIAVDATGCAFVTGDTLSDDFPTQSPYQGTNAGGYDAFITKLSATGDSLIYSTYLGGSELDSGFGIAVDAASCAYITGRTASSDFPTENPYQGTYAGGVGGYTDAIIAKLSASGDSLIYSTYLGGDGWDVGYGIAVDEANNVYVTGWTTSPDFPTQDPYQAARAGNSD